MLVPGAPLRPPVMFSLILAAKLAVIAIPVSVMAPVTVIVPITISVLTLIPVAPAAIVLALILR